jgi:hypothetical protein
VNITALKELLDAMHGGDSHTDMDIMGDKIWNEVFLVPPTLELSGLDMRPGPEDATSKLR